MSTQTPSMDPARTRLRETVADIEKQLRSLGDKDVALTKAWDDLVGQLALGPEPEVRACPKCKSLGFRKATVCGSCWTKLTPPADDED
jgi:hypothetical protein